MEQWAVGFDGREERAAMERLSRMPAAVFAYFVMAFYSTGYAYVLEARGRHSEALLAGLIALIGTLLMLRAAEDPAH